jgi:hypothetical protein
VAFTNAVPGTALTNAIVFCRIKSFLTGSRLVSVPFADHCDPLVSSPSDLNNLLSHVEQTLAAEACQYFELRCLSSTPTHFEQRATGQVLCASRIGPADEHRDSVPSFSKEGICWEGALKVSIISKESRAIAGIVTVRYKQRAASILAIDPRREGCRYAKSISAAPSERIEA